jgi:hypothetical protein
MLFGDRTTADDDAHVFIYAAAGPTTLTRRRRPRRWTSPATSPTRTCLMPRGSASKDPSSRQDSGENIEAMVSLRVRILGSSEGFLD